jgi:hypothetical protein
MDRDSLIAFVEREREAAAAEARARSLQPLDVLAERGDALLGLTVAARRGPTVVLTCPENESRFRPGARLRLSCGDLAVHGRLVDVTDGGRRLELEVRADTPTLPPGPWSAVEADTDLSQLVRSCVEALGPGAKGWTHFRALAGDLTDWPGPLAAAAPVPTDRAAADVLAECAPAFDTSQSAVVRQASEMPILLGVQGPPGTGKTRVLAAVAESLARVGRRVLVVAPTHQAVNNALSTVRHLFAARPVVKLGDAVQRESLSADIPTRLLRDFDRDTVPEEARGTILGTTVPSALLHFGLRSSSLAPNVVLVDEAGQVPLAQGACLGRLGAGSLILFGDDAQMPPVFPSGLAGDPLAVSLFRRLREVRPDAIRMLAVTYRLNRELCSVVGDTFYLSAAPPLAPSPGAAGRRWALPAGVPTTPGVAAALRSERSLIWMRTPQGSASGLNQPEAGVAAEIVAAARAGGLGADQVAVITPYRRQAAAIRRLLRERTPDEPIPVVDTVERLQGLTVELVVMSLCAVESPGGASASCFPMSPHRLNVGLSRARSRAVLLGHPSLFESIAFHHGAGSVEERIVALVGRAEVIDAAPV